MISVALTSGGLKKLYQTEVFIQTLKHVRWQDGDMLTGYLQEHLDPRTPARSVEELQESLADLFREINSCELPGIPRVDELAISRSALTAFKPSSRQATFWFGIQDGTTGIVDQQKALLSQFISTEKGRIILPAHPFEIR